MIQRFFTNNKYAVGVWWLNDDSTVAIPIPQAEYEKWWSEGRVGENFPCRPANAKKWLTASGGISALNTIDGFPHVGDWWIEGRKIRVQTGEGFDWAYSYSNYREISGDLVERESRTWISQFSVPVTCLPAELPQSVFFDSGTQIKEEIRHHSVAYDNSGAGASAGAAESCSFTMDIGSGTNRAIAAGLSLGETGTMPTGEAATVDSVSMSEVTGTRATTFSRSIIFGLANPNSGAGKTVAFSWTNVDRAIAGAITASGVDQTTPLNNGTNAVVAGSTASISVNVTSNSGDLTMTVPANASGLNFFSTNQGSMLWNSSNGGFIGGGGDKGPGTAGPITHTWTYGDGGTGTANGYGTVSGVNFKQASGSGSLMGQRTFRRRAR